MINEDYVSFETAKLLKEKGFDWECFFCWDNVTETNRISSLMVCSNKELVEHYYAMPTLQMAMKWLREVHKLGVFPTTYYREINRNAKHNYGSTIVRLDTYEVIGNDKNIEDYTFEAETYEETADKAIRYCLENLI